MSIKGRTEQMRCRFRPLIDIQGRGFQSMFCFILYFFLRHTTRLTAENCITRYVLIYFQNISLVSNLVIGYIQLAWNAITDLFTTICLIPASLYHTQWQPRIHLHIMGSVVCSVKSCLPPHYRSYNYRQGKRSEYKQQLWLTTKFV